MKKVQKLVLCLSSLILLSSCSRDYYNAYYDMSLNIDLPTKINKELGSKTKMDLTDKGKDYFNYEDKDFSIAIKPSNIGFNFKIQNKTDDTIKIIWDNSAMINEDNNTERLLHAGTSYMDGNKTQLPSIIVKHTSILEYVAPQNSLRMNDGEWSTESYFVSTVFGKNIDVKALALKQEMVLKNRFKNRIIKLLLPIEINNKISYYTFNFKVDDVNFDFNEK